MKFKPHQIIEGRNDFHPKQAMGKRKSKYGIDDKKPAKSARTAVKNNPGSPTASFGRQGHSSFWD